MIIFQLITFVFFIPHTFDNLPTLRVINQLFLTKHFLVKFFLIASYILIELQLYKFIVYDLELLVS